MNDSSACARSEMLAGAIALGEAGEAERDAYRRHLAACERCLDSLGGEREIERVMGRVAAARDAEMWQADGSAAFLQRPSHRRRTWLAAGGAAAVAALVALGVRVAVPGHAGAGLPPATHTATVAQPPASPLRIAARHAAPPAVTAQVKAVKLVVVHNVVTLRPESTAVSHVARHAIRTRSIAAPVQQGAVRVASAARVVPAGPTQHDLRSLSALRTAERPPAAGQQAESLAVVPQPAVIRDAVPIGGDGAIVPNPPAIAYSENAEGTTAFELSIDERGLPVKCTITKASGYLVLDEAVCRAAMRAKFLPRTINGRAVPSVYRDAFTFRSSDDR